MRHNIYFKKEDEVIARYLSKKYDMGLSDLLRRSMLSYAQSIETDPKMLKTIRLRIKKENILLIDDSIKFNLMAATFKENMTRLIFKIASHTSNKQIISDVLQDAIDKSIILEDIELTDHFNYMKINFEKNKDNFLQQAKVIGRGMRDELEAKHLQYESRHTINNHKAEKARRNSGLHE